MPYTPRYASVNDVANYLSLDTGDPDVAADILLALELSEGIIDSHLGVEGHGLQNVPDTTKVFSGKGTRILWTPFVRSVSAVRFGFPGPPPEYQQIEAFTYRLYPDTPQNNVYRGLVMVSEGNYFPAGIDNVEVKGDWGFATIPQPVRLATILMCKNVFDLRVLPNYVRREGAFVRGFEYISPKEQLSVPFVIRQLLRPYEHHWRGL